MDTDKKGKKYRNIKVVFSVIKILILITIVVGIPLYVLLCHGEWIKTLESLDEVVALLNRYKGHTISAYILLQILQIVISVLPGQVFQIAAGYVFGPVQAVIYAMTGAVLGTMITFTAAKLLGRDFILMVIGQQRSEYYMEVLNSKRAYVLVFLLYLIPGIPKDVISYIAGISVMKFKPFIILSALGRLPGMVGSILIGTLLYHEVYMGVGIVAVIAVISFILCLVFRKKILSVVDKAYDRLTK